MNESSVRMTQPGDPPNDPEVADWIGHDAYQYWKRIEHLIEQEYPGVFAPEWLFGGKKHGWSLRYKKSRSFCTLIPEKDRFTLLIVFGAKERTKVETIRDSLSPPWASSEARQRLTSSPPRHRTTIAAAFTLCAAAIRYRPTRPPILRLPGRETRVGPNRASAGPEPADRRPATNASDRGAP